LPADAAISSDEGIFSSQGTSWVSLVVQLLAGVSQKQSPPHSQLMEQSHEHIVDHTRKLLPGKLEPILNFVLWLTTGEGLAAGLQQLAFAAACEIVPKKNRGQTLAFMSLVSVPGSCFGAPIGT